MSPPVLSPPIPPPLSAFSQAVSSVPLTAGTSFVASLTAWQSGSSAKWRQVAANIEAETALSVADFAALILDFASELATGKKPEDCWIDACRGRHKFKGARFPPPVPAVVGRAVPIVSHAKLISDSGVGLSPDQCEALLRRVAMLGAAVTARDARILQQARLGRFVLWATFCLANSAACPFDHLPHTTEAIRIALGLGACAATETLVLVSYRTQGGAVVLELFRPTVCDAEDYHWYRPHSTPAAPHGMTCPLVPNPSNLAAQPEVVHRETTGETLVFPIYLAV